MSATKLTQEERELLQAVESAYAPVPLTDILRELGSGCIAMEILSYLDQPDSEVERILRELDPEEIEAEEDCHIIGIEP